MTKSKSTLFERMHADTKEARLLREAYEAGAAVAADHADQYNGSTTHEYRLGDCVLGKMNIRKSRPRENEHRILNPMTEVRVRKDGVDGWWAPKGDKESVLKGILVNFIDKERSDKLQSNCLVFELIEAADDCANGNSTAMPGEKADGMLYRAPKGCLIGVPEWKQLEGLWPSKAGHKVYITRLGERNLGHGRTMYSIRVEVSIVPVKKIVEESAVEKSGSVDEGALEVALKAAGSLFGLSRAIKLLEDERHRIERDALAAFRVH